MSSHEQIVTNEIEQGEVVFKIKLILMSNPLHRWTAGEKAKVGFLDESQDAQLNLK